MLCLTHLCSFPSGSFSLQTTGFYCWPSLTRELNWQLFPLQPHSSNLKVTSSPSTYNIHVVSVYVLSTDFEFMLLTICSTWPCRSMLCPNYASTHVHFAYFYFFSADTFEVSSNQPPLGCTNCTQHTHTILTRVPSRRPLFRSKDCY